MSEYRLDNGYVLTDEEIEKRTKEWEEETWEGPLVELRAGLSRLSEELEKKFNVTHDQLEAWASEYESEDWSSLKFGASTPGRPKLYAEDVALSPLRFLIRALRP